MVISRTEEAKYLPLSVSTLFLSLSFSLCHTYTTYSLSLSRPVSHTITPVRRGDNPSQGRAGGGAASWVMSVDTCQKYSLCPEKAVCGVTAVRLPLPFAPPPHPPHPTTTPSRQHKSFLFQPRGRKRARESQQGGSSALLR